MGALTRGVRGVVIVALALAVAACGAGGDASAANPQATAPVEAADFAGYAAAACTSLQSLWRAYGNPETSELSPMQRAFVEAVDAGDVAVATARAAEVRAELERGRTAAGIAAGWPPGRDGMIHLDRLLVATEAMVDGRLGASDKGLPETADRGQAAFEAAGGIEAWYGMLGGIDAALKAAGQAWPTCEGIPF